ncbi:neuronal acetylcholine receptor subunit beta-4-like [Branchiostoma lanceolatum]|uniref:neuronal acetylcholine receptor subunit beta-4-like n=1 Tax=Branchiostoma lanceolatum TaxID=7740 RepID=UPI0034561EF1
MRRRLPAWLRMFTSCVWISWLCKETLAAEAEERLVQRLFNESRYNPLIRPARYNGEKVLVHFRLSISQLINVDEKNQKMKTNVWLHQEWFDYRLSWNPREYDNIKVIRVPSEIVWRPEIVLFNNANGQYDVQLMPKCLIYSGGNITWIPPAIYESACQIDVRFFPFDQQNCSMKFASWTYDGTELDLVLKDRNAVMDDFKKNGEWDILRLPGRKSSHAGDPLPYVYFDFILMRRPLFYTINLIIPCILITSLSVLVFYLPSDCGEKITLSISVLLALTVFLLLIADIIPPTSLDVPLIGKYIMFTMIFVTFTIVTTVYILNVHHRHPSTHTMPPWVRTVFLDKLPRLLLMKRPVLHRRFSTVDVWDLPQPFLSTPPSSLLHHSTSSLQHRPETASMLGNHVDADDSDTCLKAKSAILYENQCRKYALRVSESSARNPHEDFPEDGTDSPHYSPRTRPAHAHYRHGDLPPDVPYRHGDPPDVPSDLPPELKKAVKNVRYIADYFRSHDQDLSISEDWKYVAMVIDRIFLWCFVSVCFVGTLGLFLQPLLFGNTLSEEEEPLGGAR